MENRAHALIAGLFTLLLGIGVVVAAMWLSRDSYDSSSYVLESRHPVTGLNVQATVKLRGVEVGKVESIEFENQNSGVILIGISVRDGTPITRGTVAQLRAQGITGLSYVMLEDDGKKPEPLPADSSDKTARITVNETLLDNLMDSARDFMADARQVTQRVNKLLGDRNQEQFTRALVNLEAASARAAAVALALEPAAKNMPALTTDTRQVMARADQLLGDLSGLTKELAQRVDALDRVATSAENVGDSTQALTAAMQKDTLPRINVLAEELARTSRGLDRLIAQLKREPQSVVFGRQTAAPGPGETGFDPRSGSKF
jgi:phospholipid/cholesterol/gamma-HCH transport system substrate-binding protein